MFENIPDEISMMEKFIMNQRPRVIANVELIPTPGIAYHISPSNDIVNFVPRTMTRTMEGEDLSVKRVCTGAYLLDAFRGYGVLIQDFIQGTGIFDDSSKWKGGYYIYEIPYKVCLVPGTELNPMAKNTDERWLVDYKTEGQEYPGRIIGRLFVKSVIQNEQSVPREPRSPEVAKKIYNPTNIAEVYLEVYGNEQISFTENIELKGQSYHRIILDSIGRYDGPYTEDRIEHTLLSYDKWRDAKKSCAELLSFQPKRLYKDW